MNELTQSEREQIAAEVWERTDLTMVDVGEIVGQSQGWVQRAVNRGRRS